MDFSQLQQIAERRGYRLLRPSNDQDELKAMAERRGFRLESTLSRAVYHVLRGQECIAHISILEVESAYAFDLPGCLDRAVSTYHPGRSMEHHMWCGTCKLPLLRRVVQAKKFVLEPQPIPWATPTMPLTTDNVSLPVRVQDVTQTEYRLAMLGPESQPLEKCPMCGTELSEEAVKEIED